MDTVSVMPGSKVSSMERDADPINLAYPNAVVEQGFTKPSVAKRTTDGSLAAAGGRVEEDYSAVLSNIMASIRPELAAVENAISAALTSPDEKMQPILDHVRLLGGKRLRPCLTLLSAKACGGITEETIRLAASIELVHTATLIHDDILDAATERRHKTTTHIRFGSQNAILSGDWVFTQAYEMANLGDSTFPGRAIAKAAKRVCEGEIRQGMSVGNFDLTQEDYVEILASKTGALCEVSCALGAWSAGACEDDVSTFANYGLELGIAFQIFDDWLDLWGDGAKTGKTLGTDLIAKKPTLPTLYAIQSFPELDFAHRWQNATESDLPALKELLNVCGASEFSRAEACRRSHAASSVLELFLRSRRFSDATSINALRALAYCSTHRPA